MDFLADEVDNENVLHPK